MAADDRITAARANWIYRFTSAGVPVSDFIEVTNGIERWNEWCAAWSARAAIHEDVGRAELAGGNELSAGQHLTTTAVCYHFAKFMFVDDLRQMRTAHEKAVECRTLALPYLAPPGARVEIPYEDGPLAGNLRKPNGIDRPPVVVMIMGMDSCKEEVHNAEQCFLERGMATLAFDGPGQGEGEYDYPIRHDYEVPCGAVFDLIESRGDLDAGRIGIIGTSMGGYYAPRVAARDKRVAACICNGGAFSVIDNFDPRPQTLKEVYRVRTHSDSVEQAREKTRMFDLTGVAKDITCPMFIIAGKDDKITSYHDAERLASEVSGPVELLAIEGANHVAHNRLYRHRSQSADWMARQLGAATPP